MLDQQLPPEKYFHCKNGLILRNLSELELEFKLNSLGQNMENYNFHFYNNNNDYANWIEGVFGIKNLAFKLRKAKSPQEALEEVRNIIKDGNNSDVNYVGEKTKVEEKTEEKDKSKSFVFTKKQEEKLKESIKGFTNKSDETFDKVKLMKEKIYKKSTDLNSEIEKLQEERNELYKEIAEERKKGYDVFIPALMLKNVEPKIQYLIASRNPNEISKIKSILENVRKELEEAKTIEELDLKAEILQKAATKQHSKYEVKEGE